MPARSYLVPNLNMTVGGGGATQEVRAMRESKSISRTVANRLTKKVTVSMPCNNSLQVAAGGTVMIPIERSRLIH